MRAERLGTGGRIARAAALLGLLPLLSSTAPPALAAGGRLTPATAETAKAAPAVHRLAVAGSVLFNCQLSSAAVPCYGPDQIRTAYAVGPLLAAGIEGAGRRIAIIDAFQNPYVESDLKVFDSTFGLLDPEFKVVAPEGVPPFDPTNQDQVGWTAESSLDVQWAHALAPAAAITLVLARSDADPDVISALRYAVDANLGDVISQSYGEGEHCMAPELVRAEHELFRRATERGITLFASSGDSGAAQAACSGSGFTLSASVPASDPMVTAVGATNLTANLATGAYGHEVAWGDGYGLSGGGFSTIFNRPGYQADLAGSRAGRGLPDVSINGGVLGGVLTHWGVGNIYRVGRPASDPTVFFIFGGTSAGPPQWAGITALAAQRAGDRIGFLNRKLYGIGRRPGRYAATFHDVASGTNFVPGIGGYAAAAGWDPVTGWGSPRATALVRALAGEPEDDRGDDSGGEDVPPDDAASGDHGQGSGSGSGSGDGAAAGGGPGPGRSPGPSAVPTSGGGVAPGLRPAGPSPAVDPSAGGTVGAEASAGSGRSPLGGGQDSPAGIAFPDLLGAGWEWLLRQDGYHGLLPGLTGSEW